MDPSGSPTKRRRIVIEDDEQEEVISNPDELIDENVSDEDDGEDLAENWLE
jgi:hypothetical protein